MNSQFLKENGFRKFGEFDRTEIERRSSELDFPGVYVFVLDKEFSRLDGKTDIIYIGQAGSRNKRPIYKRIIDYCNAYESAPQDKRIGNQLKRLKTKTRIGIALKNVILNNKVTITIFYKNFPQDKCKEEESKLLKRYSEDHIELPPLNRCQ